MNLIHRPPFIIHHYDTLGSTNDQLKEMSDAPEFTCPEFTCVTADAQTAGRGRRARSWVSPPGDGLYLSVLLRPLADAPKLTLLSLLTALAVAETVAQYGVAGLDIKWPNDVLVNERKLCGILIEGAGGAGGAAPRFIVGIGVNLNQPDFPPELGETATSLRRETGAAIDVTQFRDRLLAHLHHWYARWSGGAGAEIVTQWAQASSYARGARVVVTLDDKQVEGVTEGLTEDGSLLVRTVAGTLQNILAGEVTKLRKAV